MTLGLFGGRVVTFRPGILPYPVVQAVMGVWLLATLNYVEHAACCDGDCRTVVGRAARQLVAGTPTALSPYLPA